MKFPTPGGYEQEINQPVRCWYCMEESHRRMSEKSAQSSSDENCSNPVNFQDFVDYICPKISHLLRSKILLCKNKNFLCSGYEP